MCFSASRSPVPDAGVTHERGSAMDAGGAVPAFSVEDLPGPPSGCARRARFAPVGEEVVVEIVPRRGDERGQRLVGVVGVAVEQRRVGYAANEAGRVGVAGEGCATSLGSARQRSRAVTRRRGIWGRTPAG